MISPPPPPPPPEAEPSMRTLERMMKHMMSQMATGNDLQRVGLQFDSKFRDIVIKVVAFGNSVCIIKWTHRAIHLRKWPPFDARPEAQISRSDA